MAAIAPAITPQFDWHQLLQVVDTGRAVAVIGEDCLASSEDPGRTLYSEIAELLCGSADAVRQMRQSGEPLLCAVVVRDPRFRNNPKRLYYEIAKHYSDVKPVVPEALKKLAEIDRLSLFISTTFDDLLERALRDARGEQPRVLLYAPNNVPPNSEVSDALRSGQAVVFKMFGSCARPLEFALTEGDKLEYMRALLSDERCPESLVQELYQRPLILIGNGFPDWMTRLFLRLVRKTRLDVGEVPAQFISEPAVVGDPRLKFFLEHFAFNTNVADGPHPVTFVDQFSQQWKVWRAQHAAGRPPARQETGRRFVFISYSTKDAQQNPSQDRAVAMALKKALEEKGVSAWIDQSELTGGDNWDRLIQTKIADCLLFVPIISTAAQEREGYFRKEWSLAVDRLPTLKDRPFLVPVVLDGLDLQKCDVPGAFRTAQGIPYSLEKATNEIIAAYEKAGGRR